MDCSVPDFAYAGANILTSGSYNLKDDPAACQKSCQGCISIDIWGLGTSLETTSGTTSVLGSYKFRQVSKLQT